MAQKRHAIISSKQPLRSSLVIMRAGVVQLYRALQLLQCLFKLSYAPV
jgi:hypothetical protein